MADLTPEASMREYLSRMCEIRGTGGATKETSYYSALENLLNQFGTQLKPQVICNGQLRNAGAGNPDFGLYTRNQIQNGEPRAGQLPDRGVIEVKGLAEQTWVTASSAQATKYLQHYRLVLITNYREFRLVGKDTLGSYVELERYSIATDESTFWKMAGKAAATSRQHATHFGEFIRRVLMTAAPLVKAEDIAWFLASYAKDGLATLNEKDASILKPLRDGLETALGLKFEGEQGDHFFKSTLVQTLFYGVFSAWVVHAKQAVTKFDWRLAGYTLTVPMVKALFEQIATPTKLGGLGLIPILDRTSDALQRVVTEEFFKSFDTGAAVQHFYEPFLQAYDPELRKRLGVWYTPPEIVNYMVERVDYVLRTELGKVNGLADKDVYILDPCCGTGAYVVAVLRKIEQTLRAQGGDALLGDDIRQAARERVFGFELLSAPFVTAHWRVGNYLSELGAPLDAASGERAGIYLTNALTGWQPPTGPKAELPLFPELGAERDAAEHVKRDVPILVVIGNPPYDGFAGTSPAEEEGLVEPYKEELISKWGIKKFNLDDLYIRFYRLAERRINQLGRGIVAYISNYSFVSEPSYVVMREKLLETFDKIWIENMHGDRNKSEYAPDGKTSETVFAIKGFSPGIRQGVVTALAVKTGQACETKVVRFRDDINAAKANERRAQLLESLNAEDFDKLYEVSKPEPFNRYSFRPRKVEGAYRAWPSIESFGCVAPMNGLMEKRGGALIDIDEAVLRKRIGLYHDSTVGFGELKRQGHPLTRDAARFDAERTRKRVLQDGLQAEHFVKYFVRPMDVRNCYFSGTRPLWNEPRPELWELSKTKGIEFLVSRPASMTLDEGIPFYYVRHLGDNDAIRGHAYYFPSSAFIDEGKLLGRTKIVNFSPAMKDYLNSVGFTDLTKNQQVEHVPWLHALASFCLETSEDPQYIA